MRKVRRAALLALALLTPAASARPEQPLQTPQPAVARAMPRDVPKPKALPPAPKPVPDVTLTIHSPTAHGPWKMRVVNDGEIPVRIVADARLLSFDVTPRGARSPVRCELPADMRPSGDLERALVVPPNRAYAEEFEPRLYCFDAKLEALAPGAIVVAHLGWIAGPKSKPPFETSPIEGIEPEVLALKSIDAPPIALPDEPSAWIVPGLLQSPDANADSPHLSIRGPRAVDSASPNEIEIPITLRNESQRATVVRFRPELLGFDVIGSGVIEHCAWPTLPAAALREMFTTLAPRATETLDVSLGDYCTAHALDAGGLLVVRPRLDTRKAAGAALGLRTYEGTVIAMTPTLVRLHRGAAPPGPLRLPELEAP